MKVGIIGAGLIGGSIGMAARATPGVEVIVFDRNPDVAARAVARGAADLVGESIRDLASDADLIVVATPVGAVVEVAREAGAAAKPGAILTDVGSTKARVVLEVQGSLPDRVHFIGGHPMAGSEDDGIDAADAALFHGAWWVLTPVEGSDPTAYGTLQRFITTLGARLIALTPSAHDELMAFVSHVPQLTATALMNVVAERGSSHDAVLALAAGGFRDVTRIAASNPEIWLDICQENAEAIAGALTKLTDHLLELRDLVARGAREDLQRELLSARTARRSLPGKLVEGDLYEVRMPIPDRPGVLAEVTTTIGDLGINIEDLGITHTGEGGGGVLALAVIGQGAAQRVIDVLGGLGYDARAGLV